MVSGENCTFFRKSIHSLGPSIDGHGLKPVLSKLNEIENSKPPENLIN